MTRLTAAQIEEIRAKWAYVESETDVPLMSELVRPLLSHIDSQEAEIARLRTRLEGDPLVGDQSVTISTAPRTMDKPPNVAGMFEPPKSKSMSDALRDGDGLRLPPHDPGDGSLDHEHEAGND